MLSPFHANITFQSTTLPLPKGHPSPGLLAKLHIEVATLYSSSRTLLKTIKNSKGSPLEGLNIDDDIEPSLMEYLRKEWALAEVRSRKWLAVEAGEHSSGEKVGQAIAMLKDAKGRLDELRKHGDIGASTMKKMKGLKIGLGSGGKEEKTERKSRIVQEMADIESFLEIYTHMNNTVSTTLASHTQFTDVHCFSGLFPANTVNLQRPGTHARRSTDFFQQTIRSACTSLWSRVQCIYTSGEKGPCQPRSSRNTVACRSTGDDRKLCRSRKLLLNAVQTNMGIVHCILTLLQSKGIGFNPLRGCKRP